jgi:uncharacterized protein
LKTDVIRYRPLPVPTAETRPFWTAASKHALCLPRCRTCGALHYPPPPRCPNCLVVNFVWEKLSGFGRLKSWTTIHADLLPGVAPPFVIGEVELVEQSGLIMTTHIVDSAPEDLKSDVRVEISFVASEIDKEVTYPQFRICRP